MARGPCGVALGPRLVLGDVGAWFLNLPGFHGGAYVLANLEDTSELHAPERWCDEDCRDCPHNFEPNYKLEISD